MALLSFYTVLYTWHYRFFLKQDIAAQNNDKYGSCLIQEITDKKTSEWDLASQLGIYCPTCM